MLVYFRHPSGRWPSCHSGKEQLQPDIIRGDASSHLPRIMLLAGVAEENQLRGRVHGHFSNKDGKYISGCAREDFLLHKKGKHLQNCFVSTCLSKYTYTEHSQKMWVKGTHTLIGRRDRYCEILGASSIFWQSLLAHNSQDLSQRSMGLNHEKERDEKRGKHEKPPTTDFAGQQHVDAGLGDFRQGS